MSVDIECNKTNYQGNEERVKGPHYNANLFPVFAKQVASICESNTPYKGTDRGVDNKLNEVHSDNPDRQADKGAYHPAAAGKQRQPSYHSWQTIGQHAQGHAAR